MIPRGGALAGAYSQVRWVRRADGVKWHGDLSVPTGIAIAHDGDARPDMFFAET